jgi:hypothetical protein
LEAASEPGALSTEVAFLRQADTPASLATLAGARRSAAAPTPCKTGRRVALRCTDGCKLLIDLLCMLL